MASSGGGDGVGVGLGAGPSHPRLFIRVDLADICVDLADTWVDLAFDWVNLADTPVCDDVAVRRPPVFASLHGYRRAWASADLVAGLTLLVIAVPEQLATSRLAGMPPITGFYAFVAGSVLFALLGSNPQMSVGADSTIAPLFAAGVSALALTGSPHYVDLVAILAVMVGLMVMLVSILRLGWLAEFLSTPIVTGFLSGVAVIIIVHQLPDFLGLPPTGGSNPHRIGYVFTHLDQVNGWTLAIGLGVLAVMFVCVRLDRRIPGALIAMVGSTALVAALDLQAHGVAVLGTIQTGTRHLGLTGLSVSTLGSLAPLAAVVALVVLTQTAATTRAFADQGGYDVDAGRDFLGVGAGSVVAGLVGSFPVNASPPRTGAVATAGGRTQAGALGAALVVLLLVPVADVLRDVPLATLAAILIFVAIRLFNPGDLLAIARFDPFEFGLAALTLLTVVLVGVEQGIGVAVGLAILDRIRLSARPSSTCSDEFLGRPAGRRSRRISPLPRSPASSSSCSPRRSGSPMRCTSAKRSPAPLPTRRAPRGSSCSTPSGCPTWTSLGRGRWARCWRRVSASTLSSAWPGRVTTCARCCDAAVSCRASARATSSRPWTGRSPR